MMSNEGSKPRTMSQGAGQRTAYSAASHTAPNIALWRPPLQSIDAEILRDADRIRARARDLRRNHPYAAQAVRVSRLGVIGKKLRYSCRPDWRFLGVDQDAAFHWAEEWERVWESFAHSVKFHVDARRQLTFTGLMELAHDCRFVDGEALLTMEWRPDRKWSTCAQIIDVDRLSNPNGAPETPTLRGGVVLDELSAPIGYYIRNAHPNDRGIVALDAVKWSMVRRETDWGRPVALHSYEHTRPNQTRGMSAFAPVMSAMKMGAEYADTALQAAILQASYAAVLVSQQNYRDALEAINAMPPDRATDVLGLAEQNLEAAMTYHEQAHIKFNGAQVPILWPGMELKLLSPGQSATSLGDFQKHSTKSYAAGTGTDPIAVSQDYENVNYSSAKMAAANSWRQYECAREDLMSSIALPIVAAVLEEAVFSGAMWLPKGIRRSDFYDAQEALIKGTFLTQGAPNLDPVKEVTAIEKRLAIRTMTLQDALATEGIDYLDYIDQQAREIRDLQQRGLPPPGVPHMIPQFDTAPETSDDDEEAE